MTERLRHGFKAAAERIAVSTRAEIGLTVHDRLDCSLLATHLGIPIISLRDLQHDGASLLSIDVLLEEEARFSALTVSVGTRRLIIFNPAEPRGRSANSLAHELSHVLLEHPAAPALGSGGCRKWDGQLEGEADWLASTLLVPREGAIARMKAGATLEGGAQHFGVSLGLFRWRVNMTGTTKQVEALKQRGRVARG